MISVIIPVYNGEPYIANCLKALSGFNKNYEVIVVDDGSGDNTKEICRNFNIVLLENNTQRGAAFSRNKGAAHARGDILLFIDADVLIKPDTLHKVLEFFKNKPSVASAFGSYDDKPAGKNFFSQYKNLTHHFFHQSGKRDAQTFWTGCGAVRRNAFVNVNGFDEHQKYMEDIELGYRLISKGYQIFLLPHLQVKHLKIWTFSSMIYTDIFCRAIPWTKLLLITPRGGYSLNLQFSQKFSALFAFVILLGAIASFFKPVLLLVCIISLLAVVIINNAYYRFFLKRKGLGFTLLIIPFQILYYLYSSAAYAWLWSGYYLRRIFQGESFRNKFSYNN